MTDISQARYKSISIRCCKKKYHFDTSKNYLLATLYFKVPFYNTPKPKTKPNPNPKQKTN